jgi:hypothetical protein
MTSYEYNWYRWLRRELAADLGLALPRVGRRRRLSVDQEREFYSELRAAPYKHRGAVYTRWRKTHDISATTLGRIATEHRRRHFAESTARFLKEPRNQTL